MYYKLQALRGIAAVILVFYKSPFSVLSSGFIISAYLFVDLFFILSGFVLSHAYAHKIRDGMHFKRYMLLRWARVYPLHLFVLVAFIAYEAARLLILSGEPTEARTFFSVLTNLLLIQSLGVHDILTWNTPSWSISVEFCCYLLFFLLLRTFDGRQNKLLPFLIVIACYISLYCMGHKNLNVDYDWGILRCVGGFYLGVLTYRCLKSGLPLRGNLLTLIECLVVASVVCCVSFAQQHFVWVMLSIASFASAIVVFSTRESGLVGQLFLSRPIQLLGEWSYSIYMVHMLIWTITIALLTQFSVNDIATISNTGAVLINIGVFATTIAMSIITFKYIESAPRHWIQERMLGKT